jgi:hypothetical protein
MYHQGDNGDAIIVVLDVPVCGRHPKQSPGWGVQGLVCIWAQQLVAVAVLLHCKSNGDNNDNVVVTYGACHCPGCDHQWEVVAAGAYLAPA